MQSGDSIGNYIIVRLVGEGGMSIVYLAEHRADRSQVVIKQLREQLAFDRRLVDRFVQSAQIMRELRHPHLARVLDYLEHDGQYLLIEEYLPGGSLADLIDRGRPYSEEDALAWCRDALRAVNYAHENGIVHRDLKPGNLMLDSRGRVKVTDFGIARVFGGPRLTRTGTEMGTPAYMSPEQIQSPHQVDHLTDVYSMGVVLYELLTRRMPFEGETDFAIKTKVVRERPVPPRHLNSGLSSEAERIVLKAIEKSPRDRFGGCAEFALQVDLCLTGVRQEAEDVSSQEALPRVPAERSQAVHTRNVFTGILTAMIAIVAVAMVAGMVVWWQQSGSTPGRAPAPGDQTAPRPTPQPTPRPPLQDAPGADVSPLIPREAEITLSRTSGPPGTRLTVRGHGFSPGETVVVRFHTTEVGRTRADANGSFEGLTVEVPQSWPFRNMQFDFAATGGSSIRSASRPFRVT